MCFAGLLMKNIGNAQAVHQVTQILRLYTSVLSQSMLAISDDSTKPGAKKLSGGARVVKWFEGFKIWLAFAFGEAGRPEPSVLGEVARTLAYVWSLEERASLGKCEKRFSTHSMSSGLT